MFQDCSRTPSAAVGLANKKEHMKRKLYVGNIPTTSSERDLYEAFSLYGNVDSVRLVTDRDTGRPRGFGFVEMSTPKQARNAMSGMLGHQIDGHFLTVNEAGRRPTRNVVRY